MPEIKLQAQHFEEMITRRGIDVRWEQAIKCTCWSDDSGQPLYSCKACGGTGYLYSTPATIHTVLIMSLAMSKEFTPVGDFRMGDCIATIPQHYKAVDGAQRVTWPINPMYDIGEWDKVTLLDTEYRCNENLIRGVALRDQPADTLRSADVTKILGVLRANPETGEVYIYEAGTDYNIANGNTIDWIGASSDIPANGEKYSVMYYCRPVYVVYTQLPQSRDPDGQHFPKKVVLRYRDVAIDG
jgi:hypothetical protein